MYKYLYRKSELYGIVVKKHEFWGQNACIFNLCYAISNFVNFYKWFHYSGGQFHSL